MIGHKILKYSSYRHHIINTRIWAKISKKNQNCL